MSVVGVIPYLVPKAVNSALPFKQSLTDFGIESPNFFTKSFKLMRSEIDPFAALWRSSPTNWTVRWAVSSSKHGTTVVGSANLFCSNKPFRACCRISLSESSGRPNIYTISSINSSVDILRIECP